MAPPVSSDIEDTDVVRHSAGKKKKNTTIYYWLQKNALFAIYTGT